MSEKQDKEAQETEYPDIIPNIHYNRSVEFHYSDEREEDVEKAFDYLDALKDLSIISQRNAG